LISKCSPDLLHELATLIPLVQKAYGKCFCDGWETVNGIEEPHI